MSRAYVCMGANVAYQYNHMSLIHCLSIGIGVNPCKMFPFYTMRMSGRIITPLTSHRPMCLCVVRVSVNLIYT